MCWLKPLVAWSIWALLILTGCTMVPERPSAVGRAELYTTGDATYDRFFSELHAQQLELGDAPERELALRRKLSVRAESQDLSPGALGGSVKTRVSSLASKGIRLRLETDSDLEDEDAAVRLEVLGRLSDADRALVEEVASTAQGELGLLVEMTRREHELTRLKALAEGLARGADRAFADRNYAVSREVRRNLDDAQTVIPLLAARCESVKIAARQMLKKLVRSTRTAEAKVVAPMTSAPSSRVDPLKPTTKTTSTSRPPAGSAKSAPASAAPKAAARPGGDFEP